MRGALLISMMLLSLISVPLIRAQEDGVVQAQAYRVVNVRSGPSVQNAVIDQLEPGEVVPVIGRSNADNDWLLVELESQRGWVAYFVVFVTGNLNALPIVDAPLVDNGTTPIVASNAPEDTVASSSTSVTAATFRQANVRSAPSMSSAIIGVLRRGDIVTVIGRSDAQNSWLLVETPAGIGWVAYFLISLTGDVDSIPIVEPAPLQLDALVASETVSVTTRYNVNVRSDPSVGADVLAVVPFNTVLTVDAQARGGRWLRVQLDDGRKGWVLSALISSTTGDLGRLPNLDS